MFGDFGIGLGSFIDGFGRAYQAPGIGSQIAVRPIQNVGAESPNVVSSANGQPSASMQLASDAPASTPASVRSAREPSSNGGGDIRPFLQETNKKYGLPDNYLNRTAAIESSFNPNDVSSTGAAGLFQFTKGTAKRMGLSDPFDPRASTDAAARLAVENKGVLSKSLGRDPTGGELYLAHQQGASGASALLSHPDLNVIDALTPAYGGNRAAARQAVTVNGGNVNMTAGQFAGRWTSRFDGPTTSVASNRMSDQDYRDMYPNALHIDTGTVPQTGVEAAKAWQPPSLPGLSAPTNVAAAGGIAPGIGRHSFINPFAGIKAPKITPMKVVTTPAKVPQIVDPTNLEVAANPLPMVWQG